MGGRHEQTRHERGYDEEWLRARDRFLSHNPLCIGCKAIGIVASAHVVDHIVPHHGIASLFWDVLNWQPLCYWHHNSVKARLENEWRQKKIKATDMRLDSDHAIKVTRALRRAPIGLDGWPTN